MHRSGPLLRYIGQVAVDAAFLRSKRAVLFGKFYFSVRIKVLDLDLAPAVQRKTKIIRIRRDYSGHLNGERDSAGRVETFIYLTAGSAVIRLPKGKSSLVSGPF